MSVGNIPESSSQRILAGITKLLLVGRLGLHPSLLLLLLVVVVVVLLLLLVLFSLSLLSLLSLSSRGDLEMRGLGQSRFLLLERAPGPLVLLSLLIPITHY